MSFRVPRRTARILIQTSLVALSGCAGAGGEADGEPSAPPFAGFAPAPPGSAPPGAPSNVAPSGGGSATPANPSAQPTSGTQPANPSETPNTPGLQPTPGTPPAAGNDTSPSTPPETGTDPAPTQPDDATPAPAGAATRIGAELCPAGPFGAPLPANVQVRSLTEGESFFAEGPVWTGDALYFSEMGNGQNPPPSQIGRITLDGTLERGVFADSGSNGLALDDQGDLLAATHDVGAISSFSVPDGARGAVGEQTFNGQRFNSPNDLVMRSDGNVYFTDPTFQAPGNPQGATRVYRLAPSGEASVVDELGSPNGITLSLDETALFVTSDQGFRRYALGADGTPDEGATIAVDEFIQQPDGMTVDCAGNIYTTEHGARRIRVFDASGAEIGRFGDSGVFNQNITNLAFGGPNRTTLFITSTGGIFAAELNVPGLPY